MKQRDLKNVNSCLNTITSSYLYIWWSKL